METIETLLTYFAFSKMQKAINRQALSSVIIIIIINIIVFVIIHCRQKLKKLRGLEAHADKDSKRGLEAQRLETSMIPAAATVFFLLLLLFMYPRVCIYVNMYIYNMHIYIICMYVCMYVMLCYVMLCYVM